MMAADVAALDSWLDSIETAAAAAAAAAAPEMRMEKMEKNWAARGSFILVERSIAVAAEKKKKNVWRACTANLISALTNLK